MAGTITLTCRDFSNGTASISAYYEPHQDVYDKLGTYAYLCSKEKLKCTEILSSSNLSQFKWTPAVYTEEELKFKCSGAGKLIDVSKQKIDQKSWDALVLAYEKSSEGEKRNSNLKKRDQLNINCHSFSDGTISLSGFYDEIGAIAYACKKTPGTCQDFAARSTSFISAGNEELWEKAKFSESGNRFICDGRPKANPALALKGMSVNKALWNELILKIYQRPGAKRSRL
jgi:hypothetical protein